MQICFQQGNTVGGLGYTQFYYVGNVTSLGGGNYTADIYSDTALSSRVTYTGLTHAGQASFGGVVYVGTIQAGSSAHSAEHQPGDGDCSDRNRDVHLWQQQHSGIHGGGSGSSGSRRNNQCFSGKLPRRQHGGQRRGTVVALANIAIPARDRM